MINLTDEGLFFRLVFDERPEEKKEFAKAMIEEVVLIPSDNAVTLVRAIDGAVVISGDPDLIAAPVVADATELRDWIINALN